MSKTNPSAPAEPWAAWADSFQKMMSNPANLNPFSAMPGIAGMHGLPPTDAASLMKSIDPAEISRRINDLRAVESWMKLSLSTIEMSIKAMEMQRDAYASFNQLRESAQQTSQAASDAITRSMEGAVGATKRAAASAGSAAKAAQKRRAVKR